MENINLDGINITIKDLVKTQDEDGAMFIADAEVDSDQFEDFVSLYQKYNSEGNYFNAVVDKNDFYGRFGQLIFSEGEPNYKLRLVFVDSKFDIEEKFTPSFIVDGVEYQNMKEKVVRQEFIIDKLISLLVDKDIISKNEINKLITLGGEERKAIKFKMVTQVKNLDEYLESMNDRLYDIKEQEEL